MFKRVCWSFALISILASCQADPEEEQALHEVNNIEEKIQNFERDEDDIAEQWNEIAKSNDIKVLGLKQPDSFQLKFEDDHNLTLNRLRFDTLYTENDVWVHLLRMYHGNLHVIELIVKSTPDNQTVEILSHVELPNSATHALLSQSPGIVGNLEDHISVYVEPEVQNDQIVFHLSLVDNHSGTIERIRDSFWMFANPSDTYEYDVIYQYVWNSDTKQLFLQSYNGYVSFFDLNDEQNDVQLNNFRVIPHSTSGAPSLFVSPAMNHFAFDDESGDLHFYNREGVKLTSVRLPDYEEQHVSSQKVKWSPQGLYAFMEKIPAEVHDPRFGRIIAIDMHMLEIAAKEITFYTNDGELLSTLETDVDHAIEVSGWIEEEEQVIIKKYPLGQSDNNRSSEIYYVYDLKSELMTPLEELNVELMETPEPNLNVQISPLDRFNRSINSDSFNVSGNWQVEHKEIDFVDYIIYSKTND